MSARARVMAVSVALSVAAVALMIVAHVADRPAYDALAVSKSRLTAWEGQAWYLTIKSVGSWPTWAMVALVLMAVDGVRGRRERPARRGWLVRGAAVALSAAVGGLAAEALKLLLGRERPTRLVDGEFVFQGYVWRPVLGGVLDATNLGLPSSHAATAFGGAIALGLVAPITRPVAWGLALACAVSRVVASAHWVSDAALGALVGVASGYAVVAGLRARPGSARGPGRGAGEGA